MLFVCFSYDEQMVLKNRVFIKDNAVSLGDAQQIYALSEGRHEAIRALWGCVVSLIDLDYHLIHR